MAVKIWFVEKIPGYCACMRDSMKPGMVHQDDVIKCCQMEIFSALLALCKGNPPVTGGFPSQKPVARSFDVYLFAPEQTIEQTMETLMIWDAIALIMTSL